MFSIQDDPGKINWEWKQKGHFAAVGHEDAEEIDVFKQRLNREQPSGSPHHLLQNLRFDGIMAALRQLFKRTISGKTKNEEYFV